MDKNLQRYCLAHCAALLAVSNMGQLDKVTFDAVSCALTARMYSGRECNVTPDDVPGHAARPSRLHHTPVEWGASQVSRLVSDIVESDEQAGYFNDEYKSWLTRLNKRGLVDVRKTWPALVEPVIACFETLKKHEVSHA